MSILEEGYDVPYSFNEERIDARQVKVTNSLGRDTTVYELVFLNGFFGEVREHEGILDGNSGYIKIDGDREIKTDQMEVTDTFTVGQTVYFLSGGSSAVGLIRATAEVGSIPCGTLVRFTGTGGAIEIIVFRPFLQNISDVPLGQSEKVAEVAITADATAGIAASIPEGAIIIDATVLCTAAVVSETMQVKTGAGSPAVITDAIICDTDEALTRAGTIDDTTRVVTSDGVKVFALSASGRAIVHIKYI